ncbi:2OG-Fe(II) oxygenase [Sulfurimonas sp.]
MEKLYEKITDGLVNDGYIIIEDALSKTLCNDLLMTAKQNSAFKAAGISAGARQYLDANRRRDKTIWLDDDGNCVSEYLDFARGLQAYLNRTLFLGLTYYEAHFAKYEAGDFYEKHLDSFKNSKNRVVTTVYYLNRSWQKEDGGTLVLYNKEEKILQKIVPKHNTMVVFMSELFPHEVLPTRKERYSIAGWFRIDKR